MKERLTRLGFGGRLSVVAAVVGCALVAALPVAISLNGATGAAAALVAAVVVWLASALALGAGELMRGPGDAMGSLVLGMMVRMFVPLAACLIVQFTGGPLAAAGFVYFVLVFYLVALPIDTALSTFAIRRPQ